MDVFYCGRVKLYIDEAKNNSKGIYSDYDLIHFAVMAGKSLFEVITDMPPLFI